MCFVNLPLPEVWSEEGPVEEDDVLPFFRVQSNLSFLSCVKPHIELSKLHAAANEKQTKKHESETVGFNSRQSRADTRRG